MDQRFSSNGQFANANDYRLALWTAEAKYDLIQFLEDGDSADRQIQEERNKIKQLRSEVKRITEGDPGHKLVQLHNEAASVLDTVKLVMRAGGHTKDQVELGSYECLQAAAEATQSERRLRELQRYSSDLHQTIDGLTRQDHPWTSLETLKQIAGREGLVTKAAQYDRVASWLKSVGGQHQAQAAIDQVSAVRPLLGTGGVAELRARVGQADAALSLLSLLKEGESDALFELLKRVGGLENLEAIVDQADSMVHAERLSEVNALIEATGGMPKVCEMIDFISKNGGMSAIRDTVELVTKSGGVAGVEKAVKDSLELAKVAQELAADTFVREAKQNPTLEGAAHDMRQQSQTPASLENVHSSVKEALEHARELETDYEAWCGTLEEKAAKAGEWRDRCRKLVKAYEVLRPEAPE